MPELDFKGSSALTLDAKGRLNVPTRHRDVLQAHCNGELTLCKHPRGFVMLMPRPDWAPFRERLAALPLDGDGWRRMFIGSAVDVDIDSAGRLHISPELRAATGLVRDVLLVGNISRLELWDAARHAEQDAQVSQAPPPESIKSFVI